jgi:hypothetical protein
MTDKNKNKDDDVRAYTLQEFLQMDMSSQSKAVLRNRIDDLEYTAKQDLRRSKEQAAYVEELLNVLRSIEPVLVTHAMIDPRDKRTKRALHLLQATLLKADNEASGDENG